MRHPQVRPDPALGLLQLYDDALPHVYGYLVDPFGHRWILLRTPAGGTCRGDVAPSAD